MESRFLYFPGQRLSEAELIAARLDGDLVSLGEGYVPADMVETAPLRAASLAAMLGDSLAASHQSAAWIFGACDTPPERHSAQRAVTTRLHHVIDRRFVYRDSFLPADDTVVLGGVRVSSPGRTTADLARTDGEGHLALLTAWAAVDSGALAAGRVWLGERSRIPHGRAAQELLQRLEADARRVQDDVTR